MQSQKRVRAINFCVSWIASVIIQIMAGQNARLSASQFQKPILAIGRNGWFVANELDITFSFKQ